MAQSVTDELLDLINEGGGLVIDMDWWWPGYESDPVVASEHISAGGAHMLLQTTKSGLMLHNGDVVEPAARVAR